MITTPGGKCLTEAVVRGFQFAVHQLTAEELERLRQLRLGGALASADRVARGLAEGLEEGVIHLRRGQRSGTRASREPLEALG